MIPVWTPPPAMRAPACSNSISCNALCTQMSATYHKLHGLLSLFCQRGTLLAVPADFGPDCLLPKIVPLVDAFRQWIPLCLANVGKTCPEDLSNCGKILNHEGHKGSPRLCHAGTLIR